MLLAHSADKSRGIPAQTYGDHVRRTIDLAGKAATEAARYAAKDGVLFQNAVQLGAEYHDLGKLDSENQEVLDGRRTSRNLPVQHTDAGTAYLLNDKDAVQAAVLVRSHHIGLPDFIEEGNRGEDKMLRDAAICEKVNQTLPELTQLHQEVYPLTPNVLRAEVQGNASLFFRLALSCLADADHGDTAIHYRNQAAEEPIVELRPAERLAALNCYIGNLKANNERSAMRTNVYTACRDSVPLGAIVSCDSPVGTGKTTSIMAHLLVQAHKRGLRRIIVVLPFTNIITQSVQVYRDALVLPGENPELVISELHHQADFQDINSRQFTALWNAPIIVTTAVSFFETLASNTPASLRRLHNLPGSAVFIDEAHAALPSKLLPLAWHWIKEFAQDWGCYWTLASGSLNRFWQLEEFDQGTPTIPEIMPESLRTAVGQYEQSRVEYLFRKEPMTAEDIAQWAQSLPGPRLVILNTVQSAAAVALEFERLHGREAIEHISTALTPTDREKTLKRIKRRLDDSDDVDWTLVATSCVEAGVDLSFRTGVREAASLVSLLQTAGRVNRHDQFMSATVWTIVLKVGDLLKQHPALHDSANVLLDLINSAQSISPSLCTEALKREVRLAGTFSQTLLKAEDSLRFPQVEKEFRVIASDTRTVVVDTALVKRLAHHQSVDWREIQTCSVQIWGYRLTELRLPEISGHPGLYEWTYDYNDFVGYMAGVLRLANFADNCCI